MTNLLLTEDETRMREVIKMLLSGIPLNIFEAQDGARITSYNVCYTKLLRYVVQELHAADLWQLEVGNNHVDGLVLEDLHGFCPVLCLKDIEGDT